ncbi:ACT domain-containing protein acr12 [Asimina triloba]
MVLIDFIIAVIGVIMPEVFQEADQGADTIPMPIIVIDQDSDSDATIVELSFGDRLGALIDTMKALKDLGLDVTKGTVATEESVIQTRFFIKHQATGRKIEEPDMLERVRLTIINNLLKYHPECSEQLAMGEVFGIKAPEKKLDVDVATHIQVKDDGPKRSLLYIETADRPGLLMEIIKIMADININVESAEIDTEGLVAKDKFHVSYRGAALNSSLSQVLINCLRYYLRRPETDEDKNEKAGVSISAVSNPPLKKWQRATIGSDYSEWTKFERNIQNSAVLHLRDHKFVFPVSCFAVNIRLKPERRNPALLEQM